MRVVFGTIKISSKKIGGDTAQTPISFALKNCHVNSAGKAVKNTITARDG